MRTGLVIALLLVLATALNTLLPDLTSPRRADAGPIPSNPMQALREAVSLLEQDEQPERMRELLASAVDGLPENSEVRLTASVLHQQITGQYAERLKPWLDREVVDVVVLVDDEISFIDAVNQWTPERFWPVLMADDWFTPLFVEAFRPARVVRYRSDAAADADGEAALRHLALAVRTQNEGVIARKEAGESLPAPGLVVLDPHGRQGLAGYALAVAHQQPILAMKAEGSVGRVTREANVLEMNHRIMRAMNGTGLLTDDNWAAITLAGDYPYKYEVPGGDENPLSVDDRLGRDDGLARRAFTGRLLGDAVQAVYQAMGSLFIQPERPLLLNGYWSRKDPTRAQAKAWYHLTNVAEHLGERYEVTLIQNDRQAAATFQQHVNPSPQFDMWWVNSAHGTSVLEMPGEQFYVDDTPLGRAMPMYVVASFSARDPWNEKQLAGLALRGGAFWYFGSMHEPYLQAFVQSNMLINRMAPGTPLGAAARQTSGDRFGRPWKLMLIGDPLFTLRPEPAVRVAGEDVAGEAVDYGAVPEDASLGDRLDAALLTRHPDAIGPLLDEALADFASLTYEQRAHVVRLLHQQNRGDAVLDLPHEQIERHPVSVTLMRRLLRQRFMAQLGANELEAAQRSLIELHELSISAGHYKVCAKRWLVAMHEADRGTEGERFLRLHTETHGSKYQQTLIEDAIKSAAEAN
ncbi:MAG: hypothetical protein WD294_07815 [Phycisphaeraceae bacterium]